MLDQNSPLVSIESRNRIRISIRFWSPDLNGIDSIQRYLRFSSLFIVMTGASNFSAESVQSHRYYHRDMLVRYNLVPLLFKQWGSEMSNVSISVTNDIVE